MVLFGFYSDQGCVNIRLRVSNYLG